MAAVAWDLIACTRIVALGGLECERLASDSITRRPRARRTCGMHASQCLRLRFSTGPPHSSYVAALLGWFSRRGVL